jgi:hypothetical protein
MIARNVQPRQILKSVCGLKGKQWATQAVTQIHHALNFSVTHVGNHGLQSSQIAMNI